MLQLPHAATRTIAGVALLVAPAVLPSQSAPSGAGARPRLVRIADAVRERGSEETVRIAGRASVGTGVLHGRALDVAIQDGTGGIRVYMRSSPVRIAPGDSVEATGVVRPYRGMSELMATEVRVVPAPRAVPAPIPIPLDAAVAAEHDGHLVTVRGIVGEQGRSEGGQWMRFHRAKGDTARGLTIWVGGSQTSPADLRDFDAGDRLAVTGVVASYQDNPGDPVVWQVVPRTAGDLAALGIPRRLYVRAGWLGVAALLGAGIVLAALRAGAERNRRALRETEARYRQLLALTPDAVIVHADGAVLFANPAAGRLLGSSDAALVGRPLTDFVPADGLADVRPGGVRPTQETPRARAKWTAAGGATVDVEVTASPCRFHDRDAVVVLARDSAAQLRYERDLQSLALVDELTGLYNRRGFTLFAEQELARARRYGRAAVLVFADLDALKRINDDHGHATGDAALVAMGRAMKAIVRESDVVARWSGDEFVALVLEGNAELAGTIAGRLDAALRAATPESIPFPLSASVGTSLLDPGAVQTLAEALDRADMQLYRQKAIASTRRPNG